MVRQQALIPAYLVDGMLGTTARKLRILGFDTLYDTKSQDSDLLKVAIETGRILLTGDYQLYVSAKTSKAAAILVSDRNEEDKLFHVLDKSGVRGIDIEHLNSRCSICNGVLFDTGTKKYDAVAVYECQLCGKRYWRGSHWKKMESLFERANSMLKSKELGERSSSRASVV